MTTSFSAPDNLLWSRSSNGVIVSVPDGLATNTALRGVLVGTPVTPALTAYSVIISNIVVSADMIMAGNRGGNSEAFLTYDSSAGTLTFAPPAYLDLGTYAFTAGTPPVILTTTNASTSASVSAESLLVSNTQTGIGGVGGRARFYMTTNVALGGWSNALKADVLYGAAGRTTGLGSSFCAELTLSAGTTSGTYAPLEIELNAPTAAKAGTASSFIYMNATDTAAVINAATGYLFEIGAGVTDTAGGIFEAETNTDSMSMTHVLKIRIAGTAYYIPLNTSKAF